MTAKARTTRSTRTAAAEVAEPKSMYAKTTTSWSAGEGEQDQPRSGRMGDEEITSAAEPVHPVGGTTGLSGGTTSN